MPYKDSETAKRYNALHYQRNKKRYTESRKRRRNELLAELKGKPCEDCGVSYPIRVMHLHHENHDKEANVSTLVRNGTIEAARKEAKKCVVLCANCHALRH